ncbi:tandem-95 repeat protein [Candidatus Gracilibacteria bacterium]|nr:tandem-95 repeat protein [Candidatus Gracilibacteria bacterium]
MYRKNTLFRILARAILVLFLSNTVAPTLQFAFADSTQYYVDATSGNDANDGLSPGTAWQTLAQVSGTTFLQGDTVSLLCSETWAETLTIAATPGSVALPITVNSYGSCPGDTPTVEGVTIVGSSYIIIDGIDIANATPGPIVSIDSSDYIALQNSTISGSNATCTEVLSSTGILIDNNIVTNCLNALSVSGSEATITNNSFTNITNEGVNISSTQTVDLSYNTLNNIAESAIIFGSATDVLRNDISTICTTGSSECAAIRNSSTISGSVTSTVRENSIKNVGTGIGAAGNAGVLASSVNGVIIEKNGIQNAQYAVRLIDAANTDVVQNTLLSSRINTFSVIQNNTGAVTGNSFTGNTFIQRAPDYPYIEIRDEVPGNGVASGFVSFDSNNILPNYKPNTSYLRTVKFGGETAEYTKADLNSIDTNITKFEYFGYKPYVNTGTYATANLLTNGDFTTDASNWTPSALSGGAPSLSHNPAGNHVGGSATVTPAGGNADRIWVTNDAILSVSTGQVFHVTGYANSSSGNINLRAFLHSSGDKNVVYSDIIAETYASATGRTFSFYLTATSTAADAQLTLETSNNDVAYEIDEISFRRLSAFVKNTSTFEVLAYENPSGSDITQSCPGGAQCFAYVDSINASTNWPITIPAYTTSFVLWNNSSNIITTPLCSMNLSAGSVPTGQPVDVSWNSTGSTANTLNYLTYTGAISEGVSGSGTRTFIPPYDAVTTISLNLINDVGPNTCSVQVTTTNTAPSIFPVTITGAEDMPQIDGTLSGIDMNPGDTVIFEKFTDPSFGVVNVDGSGTIQYFPFSDFCGTDSFLFRASDQYGHYADPVTQNIDMECINDAPTIVNDSGSTNGPMVAVDVLANDTDIDNAYESQTFSIVSFSQPLSGSVVQNGNDLEYTPIGSFSGADIFTYRMQDQSGALSTNTGTVTIHVVLPNIAPVSYNMSLSVNEDAVLSDVLSGSDINGDILSFTALTLPMSGALNLLANGTFSYTPSANIYGSDTFDFIANDGFLDSNTGTLNITINSVPDAPTGVDDSYSVNQDTLISMPVLSNDYDVDSLTFTITGVSSPSNGVAVLSGTNIEYTPGPGYFGADSFTYMLEDELGLLSPAVTVSMNVVFTNAPPTANPSSFSVNEDATYSGAVTGSDPELSTLTYILDSTTSNGVLSFTSTGGIGYVPTANFNGIDSFTFHVSDGVLTSTAATVNITVDPINDIPTANTATITAVGNSVVSSGNTYTGVLTGNDIDGNPITFTAATLPVHGLLSMTSTGYITYTPALGYIGSDSFSFRTNDGVANSSNTTVNINITSNGVPIPLGSFTVSAPSSVYSGSAFSVTVQARDLAGSPMTSYTGSIVFTSSDPLATLPSSGASISFGPGDSGVKTFSNALALYTNGTISISVQDTVLGSTGSANVSVSTQAVSAPFGPGGLAPSGGGGSNSEQNQVYGSAPTEPVVQFVFVGEGAELLNKLMLVNRFVSDEGTNGSNSQSPTLNPGVSGNPISSPVGPLQTYLMQLEEEELFDLTSTLTLRAAFWDHLHRAIQSSDADNYFENARIKLNSISGDENERLMLVRDVLLRILDSQQRRYHEIIDRDITLSGPTSSDDEELLTDEPLSDTDISELDLTDTTGSELDLSEIDLSELDLTDEELALLLE